MDCIDDDIQETSEDEPKRNEISKRQSLDDSIEKLSTNNHVSQVISDVHVQHNKKIKGVKSVKTKLLH